MSSLIEAVDTTLLGNYHRFGDEQAFAELNRKYVDFVYATALRQCGDDAMAADVTQAVFLVLAKKSKSIRANAIPTWLHRVTTYAVKNAQRAERRRRRHERAAAIQRPEVAMSSAVINGESEAIKPLLDRAIASLPAKDQAVVIERFLCGREPAEIAVLVGASTMATQKRLERAVKKLRGYFERNGIVLGVAFPWPAIQHAPVDVMSGVLASSTLASAATQTLSRKIMSHLFLAKYGTVAACTCLIAAAAVTAGAEMSARSNVGAPTSVPDRPALVAQLKHDTTVSIEGIFAVGDPGRCWLADGTPIATPSWKTSDRIDNNQRTDHGMPLKKFGIVVRVRSTASTPPKLCTFYFNDNFGSDSAFKATPVDKADGDWTGLTISFSPNDSTATMRFVAAGGDFQASPFPPTIWGAADGNNINGRTPAGDYLISKPFLRGGVAAVNISTTLSKVEDRLEATVSEAGRKRMIIGTIADGQSINWMRQQIDTFPGVTSLGNIESIELKYRPLEWAEFRNVSLRAGEMKQVQIAVGAGDGPSPATEEAPAKAAVVGEIYISGDTPRPGVYSLTRKLNTLFEVLDLAEATSHVRDTVRLTRNGIDSQQTLLDDVPLGTVLNNPKFNYPLESNDVILVSKIK